MSEIDSAKLKAWYEFSVYKVKDGKAAQAQVRVASEVPFTININENEIVTLLSTPIYLKELTYGFLFTSGMIKTIDEVQSFTLDTNNWIAYLEMAETPKMPILQKRVLTSGCGKGIMFSALNEVVYRKPLVSHLRIASKKIIALSQWLQHCSELYRSTGGIHTAAISIQGNIPQIYYDDIGRHNSVDKVIGKALLEKVDFSNCVIICSGRTSSEILHKSRVCGIAINVSRGAPTHQTVLKARDMGMCVIGFARSNGFTIYSHKEHII